jgi:hypothetical protein
MSDKAPKKAPTALSLAEAICLKFPQAPSRQLSRILYNENIERFKDVTAALTAVRTVRGAAGKGNRKQAKTAKVPKPECPSSLSKGWEKINLGNDCCVLSLSDIHIPYHDETALREAVRFAKKTFDIDVLLLNGDFSDFYAISRFEKDPKERDFRQEIILQKQGLVWLKSEFPESRVVFKQGNHELRWDHYIWNKAPELWNLDCVQLHDLLGLTDLGIELVGDNPIMAGKLPILHGHELPRGFGGAVNHARSAYMRAMHSVLVGHGHRTSFHCDPDMFSNEVMTWSQGCLCELSPAYNRVSKYNLGFAVIEVDSEGEYQVFNYRMGTNRKFIL